ncbi:MAG: DEAD/DEAH box helicase, partial [Bacteroidota bacterium]
MRKKYGNTWWGKQWLNSLNNIDFSNRLPRGRTYANKGAVLEISFNQNTIEALVQGSRRKPYRVKIKIPPFTALEKAKVLEVITGNPLFLSQLLNRRLPPELNSSCANQGVKIFPTAWKDINGSCSCPDWAIPCKHLAAVLYMVANEIDQDPFCIFSLHNFDLLKGLEGIGFSTEKEKEIPILSRSELRQPVGGKPPKVGEIQKGMEAISQIDFTQIPDCQDDFLNLLEEHPVFYPSGDFRKVLKSAYKKVAKEAGKTSFQLGSGFDTEFIATSHVEILLSESGTFLHVHLRDSKGELLKAFEEWYAFTSMLSGLSVDRLYAYSPALGAVCLLYRFTLHLAEQSAYIPQLLKLGKQHYHVRWVAATLQPQVKFLLDLLEETLPMPLLFYQVGKKLYEPITEDSLQSLLSLFLGELIKSLALGFEARSGGEISSLFFQGKAASFQDFENHSYPGAIQLWLNKFYLVDKRHVPVLQVLEPELGYFEVDLQVEDRDQPLEAPISIQTIFEEKKYQVIRMSLLRDLAMLVEHFPQLSIIISSQGKETLCFDSKGFVEILFHILPVIRLFGIKVLLPKALRKLLRPQLSLSVESEGKIASSSLLGLENLMNFHWKIAIGDQMLSREEFLSMLEKYAGIVRLQDQYVYFNEAEIQSLLNKLEDPPDLSGHEILQAALTESFEGARVTLDENTRKLIEELMKGTPTDPPEGLKASFRPYQFIGYNWLYKNSRIGFGSLIADDMGLGKTLQVIATLLKLKEEGELAEKKALVVVPTTLLSNWGKEIEKFAPTLIPHIYHGPNRTLEPIQQADVLITTYGVLRSEGRKLQKLDWLVLVIDEAQNIKNPGTAQTKAVKKVQAPIKIAMSGTPVENRLSEYWSIFDFANQGYLGKLRPFLKNYAKPIEVDRDQEKLQTFKKITAPFILRRLKSDKSIIEDLPEKIEQDQFCELSS